MRRNATKTGHLSMPLGGIDHISRIVAIPYERCGKYKRRRADPQAPTTKRPKISPRPIQKQSARRFLPGACFYAALRCVATASTSAWRLITLLLLSFPTLSFSFYPFTSCQSLSSPNPKGARRQPNVLRRRIMANHPPLQSSPTALQGESNALAVMPPISPRTAMLRVTTSNSGTTIFAASRKPSITQYRFRSFMESSAVQLLLATPFISVEMPTAKSGPTC